MPRNVRHSKQTKPRPPSIQHFQKLDKKSKEEDPASVYPKYKGEMVRFRSIEWLRLECVQRFYKDSEAPHDNSAVANDLSIVKSGKHHSLIGLGTKPKGPGIFNTLPQFAQTNYAVIPIKPGEKGYSTGRFHVSVDPFQDDKAIIKGILQTKQNALSSIKLGSGSGKLPTKKVRSKGGGRKHTLAQLFETLTLYDKYQSRKGTTKEIKQLVLGLEAKTFGKSQGEKIISMAKYMIQIAGNRPASVFHEKFE